MGQVMFYHLTRRPLEATLPDLLSRSLERGWRVVVRGRDANRLAALDAALWTGREDSFLPHGMAGGAHDNDQPVLLTTATDCPNAAQCLITVDSAPMDPTEAAQFERVCVMFDGTDEGALAHARGQWRQITQAGASAQYWSEASGKWEKKAES